MAPCDDSDHRCESGHRNGDRVHRWRSTDGRLYGVELFHGRHMNDIILKIIVETMPDYNTFMFLWDQGNRIEIVARFN